MTLDELEQVYRARQQAHGEPLVILAMQMAERDVRSLRPILTHRGQSLSEHVRDLLQQEIAMLKFDK